MVSQTALVRLRHIRLHRLLGWFGAADAVLMAKTIALCILAHEPCKPNYRVRPYSERLTMEGVAIIMTICRRRSGSFSRMYWKLALILCLSLLAPCGLVVESMISGTLKVDEASRTYLLHTPTGYQSGTPTPLALVFHGAQMTAALMANLTQLNQWADKAGFIVAYPQGLELRWTTDPTAPGQGADVAFVRALISNLESAYTINPNRIIAAGISNGAEFAQELGCSRDFDSVQSWLCLQHCKRTQ